jgi:hypothetical protein
VNKVKSTVSAVATLAKQSFVDPVVNGFKAAATAFKNQVLDPAVDWFNRHVLDPGQQAVSNAKQKAADVLHTAYSYGKQALQNLSQAAQVMYRSTAEYAKQRTAEIKQKLIKFACGTSEWLDANSDTINKMSDAAYAFMSAETAKHPGQLGSFFDGLMGSVLGPGISTVAGFEYNKEGDFYYTNQHSIQSQLGFSDPVDAMGGLLAMNLDDNVVEFAANGLDYRLELWKGNYAAGEAYGGEMGLYYRKPGSSDPVTSFESNVTNWYATVDPEDQVRMVQSLYLDTNPDKPVIYNDTNDYADGGKHFWNLAIRTDRGVTKDDLIQKGDIYVDDPQVREAMAAALRQASGVSNVAISDTRITYTWRRRCR